MEPYKVEYIEPEQRVEHWLVGVGNGEIWVKGYKVAVRMNKYGELMYNIITIVNNTILNTGNLLRK